MPSSQLIAVVFGCSDHRQDAFFAGVKAEIESCGGLVYPVRTPGASIVPAFSYELAELLVQPFLAKGATIVVVRSHLDCAGLDWAFNNEQLNLRWSAMGIRSVDELGDWCVSRTIRHLGKMAAQYPRKIMLISEIVAATAATLSTKLIQQLDSEMA